MITKKIRVTVDGKPFDVLVELPSEPAVASVPHVSHSGSVGPSSPVSAPASGVEKHQSSTGREGSIISPLSGLVAAIPVKAGQQVKEGEHVLTLEAMKMNTFVFAPKAGTIKEISVEVGAAVQENQVLMVLE